MVYILEENPNFSLGGASKWWLHHSITALQNELDKQGAKLYLFKGEASLIIPTLAKKVSSSHIVCSRLYEPEAIKRDQQLKKSLATKNITLDITQGNIIYNPKDIRNKSNTVYRVFTPFYKACLNKGIPTELIDKPTSFDTYTYSHSNANLDELNLLPTLSWDSGLKKTWQPGELAAHNVLEQYIQEGLTNYLSGRDYPSKDNTSHLSPYLHFGEISPRRIINRLNQVKYESSKLADNAEGLIRQLLWREFSYHMLVNFPQTTSKPYLEKFNEFPWKRANKKLERAWQQGQTGYPVIDAGMRELWQTGYMHNRVRMIVASFLTKNGLLHWKTGAKWFWDTLVDADLAQNTMNWQWVAGCGVDASPYFRIFNPVTQSKKFDPEGIYIRHWCPELKLLSNKYIHTPWIAPKPDLQNANITLDIDYPNPILDLKATRERALLLYKSL